MNISFDATPLVGDLVSGVGWCEASLTAAFRKLYPEISCRYEYFSLRAPEEKKRRLAQYCDKDAELCSARFSPLLYRTMTNFSPLPYSAFFGKWADITHFFNYIVPPGVGSRTVVTVHDMVYRAYPETMNARTRLMLQTGMTKSMARADAVVTDSEFSRSEIIKYYPQFADKLHVVPCGVDMQKFRPASEAEIRRVRQVHRIEGDYFLFLGTLEPRKNLVRLVEGYSLLHSRYPDCPKLVLAGGRGWQYQNIFDIVELLHLEQQVQFLDYVPAADMAGLYSGAFAFVFPSLYEGFGMPPLEAMACGTPVLTSKAASLPEAVGKAAVLVHPKNLESIEHGLELLLNDTGLRERLVRMGMRQAARMSWENAAEKLMRVYQGL